MSGVELFVLLPLFALLGAIVGASFYVATKVLDPEREKARDMRVKRREHTRRTLESVEGVEDSTRELEKRLEALRLQLEFYRRKGGNP